jgi:alpha-ketoglutaric semialdehyde dehydrogenase
MRPALLLIDLQRDYLDRAELTPSEAVLIPHVEELLNACRRYGVPVMHVMTLVRADGSNRMPHWEKDDLWECVEGTPGAQTPPELAPLPNEPVFAKPFFSAFDVPALQDALSHAGVDTLILAGIYTHVCVRAAAMDGYSRGYEVWIAADGVASSDPLHARLTLEFLEGRVATFLRVAEILARIGAVG